LLGPGKKRGHPPRWISRMSGGEINMNMGQNQHEKYGLALGLYKQVTNILLGQQAYKRA
jgi:hypothetical protein